MSAHAKKMRAEAGAKLGKVVMALDASRKAHEADLVGYCMAVEEERRNAAMVDDPKLVSAIKTPTLKELQLAIHKVTCEEYYFAECEEDFLFATCAKAATEVGILLLCKGQK